MKLLSLMIGLIFLSSCVQKKESKESSFEQLIRYKKQVGKVAYYFPPSLAIDQRTKLIEKCEAALFDNIKLINESFLTDSIDIEFIASRREMLKYTGLGASGMTFPERKTVFLLANEKEAPIKHELMHLVAMLKWGEPHQTSIWMNEGLATLSENNCNNYNVEQIYCYLIANDKLIKMDSLANKFYSQLEMISYHQSAFIAQYLLDQYGIPKFRELWISGFGSFYKVYGFPFDQVLSMANEVTKGHYPQTPNINWKEFEKGCN